MDADRNSLLSTKTPPHNIIVRHRDKRIRGKDANGRITYNEEFRPTYYHLQISHIKMKNPIFDGIVRIEKELSDLLGTERIALMKGTTGMNIQVKS